MSLSSRESSRVGEPVPSNVADVERGLGLATKVPDTGQQVHTPDTRPCGSLDKRIDLPRGQTPRNTGLYGREILPDLTRELGR